MAALHRGAPAVAVRTADLAHGQLGVEPGQRRLRPGHGHDRAPLGTAMVEVEHVRIAKPAVDAAGAGGYGAHMSKVAGPHATLRADVIGGRPRPGAAAMAVRAHDLALGHLRLDHVEPHPVVGQAADLAKLVAQVVELQHDGVALAAVAAAVAHEVCEDVGLVARSATAQGGAGHALETDDAPTLPAVESRARKVLVAAAASSHPLERA